MDSIVQPAVVGTLLCLLQLLLALPWMAALDPVAFKAALRRPATWLYALSGCLGAGIALGLFVNVVQDPGRLLVFGRAFGALLHAQLILGLLVLIFVVLFLVWPKGAAVALAAFREGVRQPMFWLLLSIGLIVLLVTPFVPYFTFGEDYKFVKELGYEVIMVLAAVFAVLAAAISISEEIEGRTAITLMSKPVSRRQFLLGKFLGTLFAAALLVNLLGLAFYVVLWFKPYFDNEPLPPPAWLEPARQTLAWMTEPPANFTLGAVQWFDMAWEALPGLLLGGCQVMMLLSIAVALATRLPWIVNIITCYVIYLLGHLSQVLVQVSEKRQLPLVNFVAQFFDALQPGLEFFNLSTVITRDVPPPTGPFLAYVGSAVLCAMVYTTIALLFGLILFEDRDLA